MESITESFKKHPYLWAGGIFLVGVVFLLYYYSGSSSSNATTYGPSDSELGAEVQLAEIQASQVGQTNQINAQLQALALDASYKTTAVLTNASVAQSGQVVSQNIAQIQSNTEENAQNDELTALLAQYQTQEVQTASELEAAITESNNNAAVQIGVAGIQGQTEQDISANEAQVQESLANAQVSIAKAYAGASETGSIFSGLGGIVKAIL